jgi:hypothetical protein
MPFLPVLRLLVLLAAGFAVGAAPCAWDTPAAPAQTSGPTLTSDPPVPLSPPEIRHDIRPH